MSHEKLRERSAEALCDAVIVLEKTVGDLRDILIEGAAESFTNEIFKLRDELIMEIGYRAVVKRKANKVLNLESE